MGTSWLVYKLIRRITSRRKRLQYGGNNVPGNGPGYSSTTYNSYPHGSGYGSMYGSSMMHGGLNQASSYGGYPMFGGGGSY